MTEGPQTTPREKKRKKKTSGAANANRRLAPGVQVDLCSSHTARLLAGANPEGRCDLCAALAAIEAVRERLASIEFGVHSHVTIAAVVTECLLILADAAPTDGGDER